MTLSSSELARYNRHLLLPEIGSSGQEKIKASQVLIIGAGGLGSPAALYLAAAGVGRLCMADGDHIEISNLHRQVLFETRDIGQPKAEVASARLRSLNPDIHIEAYPHRLSAAHVLDVVRRFDLVVDGSDRLATRYLINDACVLLRKPLVSAAIHRFEGHAMVYVPGKGPCYRCLFPNASDDLIPNCAEAGVLGVLPGVLGTIQATEALKLILGLGDPLIGRFLTYDALGMRFKEFSFKRREDCAVCGDHPSILAPTDTGVDPQSLPGLARIHAVELAALLNRPKNTDEKMSLIDVREPGEFDSGHLEGAVNIPLGMLDERWADLSPDAMPVFLCRSGTRSLRACAIAARHGRPRFGHLEGGLLAWVAEVDSSLKVQA